MEFFRKRLIPPCERFCPAGINVMGYIYLSAKGEYEEALKVIRESCPLPGSISIVCPRPCEVRCTRAKVDEAVSICLMHRFLAEWEMKRGILPQSFPLKSEKRVFIIGSGPAGLVCAYHLRRVGYPVSVFCEGEPGGILTRAPEVPREMLDWELKFIESCGIAMVGELDLEAHCIIVCGDVSRTLAEKLGSLGVKVEDGRVFHEAFRTGVENIFACGDANSPGVATRAVGTGRRLAQVVERYLGSLYLETPPLKNAKDFSEDELARIKKVPRKLKEVEEEAFRAEILRCLACGSFVRDITGEEFFARGHRACQGCGAALALRLATKVLGKNTVATSVTGCIEIISSYYPDTSWKIPWIHVAFEVAGSVASGIESGLKALMRKGRIPEREIHVIAIAGDGGTADIGLQALSGALERRHKFIYLCYDNEAYMNTGIQRSGLTPFGAWTTTSPPGEKSLGQMTWKKNMPEIAAAHGIPYVATACISFPIDFMEKMEKAKKLKPAYIHVLCPCPVGWRYASDMTIELGKLAVETGMFPLYEIENGKYRITYELEELKPIREYIKRQRRFSHLQDKVVEEIQRRVVNEWNRLRRLTHSTL